MWTVLAMYLVRGSSGMGRGGRDSWYQKFQKFDVVERKWASN